MNNKKVYDVLKKTTTAENLFANEFKELEKSEIYNEIITTITKKIDTKVNKKSCFSSKELGSDPENWEYPLSELKSFCKNHPSQMFGCLVLRAMKKRAREENESWETWESEDQTMYKLNR